METQNPDAVADEARLLAVRIADTRFVMDQFAALGAGHNPDADHRALPAGLDRILDLTRVGAFGHSLGSRTVVGAIEADRRIDTGVAMDGGPLGVASLDRPFLMLGNPIHRRAEDRALTIQRRYLTAWFDHTLRGRQNPLLRGESPHFPEVDYQP